MVNGLNIRQGDELRLTALELFLFEVKLQFLLRTPNFF